MKTYALLPLAFVLLCPALVQAQTAEESSAEPAAAAPAPAAPSVGVAPLPVSEALPDDGLPHLQHTPRARVPTRAPVTLTMQLVHPERIAGVTVHWQMDDGAWAEAPVRRDGDAWTATLPAPSLETRRIAYYLTLRTTAGQTLPAFADAASPHVVVVRPEEGDVAEAMELARNARRRLEFTLEGEYVDFGARPNTNREVCGADAGERCEDGWYALRGGVRYRYYRALRSVAVRVDRLVGRSTAFDPIMGRNIAREMGLVAGTVELEFRAHDLLSLTFGGILGADESSVQGGVVARAEVGVDRPTRALLSVQHITGFGTLVSAWMRFVPARVVPMGVGIEATNQPGGQDYGVRLLYDLGLRLSQHFTVTLRGGYGARRLDASGFTAGLGLGLTL